jgi:Protein of unknown function (DUF2950)
MLGIVRLRRMRPSRALMGAGLFALGLAGPGGVQRARAESPPAATAEVAPEAAQPVFPSAEEAAAALEKSLQSGDVKALEAILGPGSAALVMSGDPVADANARKNFVSAYADRHELVPEGDDKKGLTIGTDGWPFPIPIVRSGSGWHFDAKGGAEELVNRRIGRNELLTIRALLAGVAAEKEYYERVKSGAGAGVYAERFLSMPGTQDGLYWEAEGGAPLSPLGPLIEEARGEGYPGAASPDGKPIPYHGYLFRVLKAQGPNAPGGEKDYVRDGKMTEGFAFVAWPAEFGRSGVMTFIVDQDGVVFQKDLGPDTAKIAGSMTRFDPDLSWTRVDIAD